jgi:hypothetical protein
MSDEITIPINLEMRKRGITSIKMTGSDALGVTIDNYDSILVFARYDVFDEFIREAEDQFLDNDPPLAAEDIELILNYLKSKRKAFEDAAKELRG